MKQLKFRNIFSAIENYDVILLDIWGVIVEGSLIYPGVVDSVNELSKQKKLFYVSNSPRPSGILWKMLESWGLETSSDKIFCSGEVARKLLSSIYKPSIYHLTQGMHHDILLNTNYNLTQDLTKANVLLLTLQLDEGENLEQFDELFKEAVNFNIHTICANPDVIIPNEGKVRYGPGYFAKKIEELGGKVSYTGKPYPQIYEAILEKISNIPKDRILMIGDTFETDIKGAQNVGIHSALVLTGNSYKLHQSYENIEDKLRAITLKANQIGLVPNFVTSFT